MHIHWQTYCDGMVVDDTNTNSTATRKVVRFVLFKWSAFPILSL